MNQFYLAQTLRNKAKEHGTGREHDQYQEYFIGCSDGVLRSMANSQGIDFNTVFSQYNNELEEITPKKVREEFPVGTILVLDDYLSKGKSVEGIVTCHSVGFNGKLIITMLSETEGVVCITYGEDLFHKKATFEKIGLDMDGVICNFIRHFVENYNLKHADDIITEENVSKSWDISKCGKYSHKEIYTEKGFFSSMPFYEGIAEILPELYRKYEIYFITTCPAQMCHEKMELIKSIITDFNEWDMIFTNRKDMVSVDILIDDAPHNILALKDRAVVYSQLYNADISCDKRIANGAENLRQWIVDNCLVRKGEL